MSALALSCVIFLLVLGGIFIGTAFRRALPEHHLSKETQDVVRLGAGLTATIAALVLGLLIGGAKSSFDTRSSQVNQLTANIILLDNLLAQYGAEATPLRKGLRGAINPIVDRLWHEKITTEPLQLWIMPTTADFVIFHFAARSPLPRRLKRKPNALSRQRAPSPVRPPTRSCANAACWMRMSNIKKGILNSCFMRNKCRLVDLPDSIN